MAEYTLSYNESVQGWTSFFSFIPDWMVGMNNRFYTFKNGNLYIHNENETRNNYYGVQYTSKVKSVFNISPTENKLFKTLNIEGDAPWDATMVTDIQNTGFIDYNWFEKKEGSFYAFVRNSGQVPALLDEYALRSVNGIGRSQAVSGTLTAPVIEFSTSVSIGSIISIGDAVYFALPPYTTPQLAGEVTAININLPAGTNEIVLDATIPGAVSPIPIADAYIMFIKNSIAESHGVLGHYCIFELENDSTKFVELFVVESEIMKSFP